MRTSSSIGRPQHRPLPNFEVGDYANLRQRLESMAHVLRRSGEDTKWRELDRILDDPLVHDPANGTSRRKIVVFTEARDTLEYSGRPDP